VTAPQKLSAAEADWLQRQGFTLEGTRGDDQWRDVRPAAVDR
jgi:hypothetical protein